MEWSPVPTTWSSMRSEVLWPFLQPLSLLNQHSFGIVHCHLYGLAPELPTLSINSGFASYSCIISSGLIYAQPPLDAVPSLSFLISLDYWILIINSWLVQIYLGCVSSPLCPRTRAMSRIWTETIYKACCVLIIIIWHTKTDPTPVKFELSTWLSWIRDHLERLRMSLRDNLNYANWCVRTYPCGQHHSLG